MENKKKKIMCVTAIVIISVVICSVGGYTVYKQNKIKERSAKVKAEIVENLKKFEKEGERDKKLELFEKVETDKSEYQKEKDYQKEVVTEFDKILKKMKSFFSEDYDKVIAENTLTDIEKNTDKEKITTAKNNLENLLNTIESEKSILKLEKFEEKISNIQELITQYTNRIKVIEEEEAKKKAEEEAKKKAEEEAKKTVEAIFPYVDFLFVSEETSRRMLQRTGTLEEIMKGYADTYGCTLIATTRREAVSPTHHNFNSKIYMNGNFYEEEPYNNIEVIDRIGSGDAYLAGVLYGLIKFGTPERAIEIGNALSAVKNTVAGDMSASSIEEIESVIKSHKATGHQDEMVR